MKGKLVSDDFTPKKMLVPEWQSSIISFAIYKWWQGATSLYSSIDIPLGGEVFSEICKLSSLNRQSSDISCNCWYWKTTSKRQNPFPWTSRSCQSVCVMLSDPAWVEVCSLNAAWPQIVLRWPATNDSGWIKTSLGLIGIPGGNAHDSGHPRPCQKPAVVTCPLIIHPKHRNNVSFLCAVRPVKGTIEFSLLSHNKQLVQLNFIQFGCFHCPNPDGVLEICTFLVPILNLVRFYGH